MEIKLVGEDFDSSITAPIMEGFINLQKSIYKIYKIQIGRNLTPEEKQNLQINVEVSNGSSFFGVDISDIKVIFANMNGTESLIGLGIICTSIATPVIISRIQEHRLKMKEQENSHLQQMKLFETLDTAIKSPKNTLKKIIEANPDSILIEDTSYTPDEMKSYIKTTKEKPIYSTHTETGEFFVETLNGDWRQTTEKLTLSLSSIETKEQLKNVILQKKHIENKQLINSANNRGKLNLQLIITRDENNNIKKALLDKILSQQNLSNS